MKVDQLMTRDVHTCGPDDSLADAVQLMRKHDCGIIPVVRDEGHVIAVVTDRDICMAALDHGSPLQSLSVASAMSRAVHTCLPDEDVRDAEERMRRAQVRRLPVTDPDRNLVGILSLNDIALASEHRNANGREQITPQEVAHTLGAISEHKHPPARPKA